MVPKYHRMYWEFHKRWLDLLHEAVDRSAARLLVSDIDDALRFMPTEVRLAARRLQIEVATFSDDIVTVSRAAGEYVGELACYEATVSDLIAELGRIVAEVNRYHGTGPEAIAFVDPLVDKICQQSVFENPYFVQETVGDLCANKAFRIARRLVGAVQKHRCIDEAIVAELSEVIDLSSAALSRERLDPNRFTASALQLIAQMDAAPPKGVLTWEAVRVALDNGMIHRFADAPEKKGQFIKDTLDLVSLAAGEGPFRGDVVALTDSVARLDETYPADKVTPQEIRDTLAALLVVSFYDTSTADDRDRLVAQLHDIFESTWAELLKCLKELGLENELDEGASQAIEKHMEEVKSYVSDPLWPMYKYPLSDNEIARITSSALLGLKPVERVLRDAARRHHDRQRVCISGLGNLVATIIETALFEIRYPKVGGAHFWRDGRVFRVFVPHDMYANQEQLRSVVSRLAYGFFLGYEPPCDRDSPSR